MKFPETYCPVLPVKLNVQNSHGRLVPVVESTVKAPLMSCWDCDREVEKLVPTVTVVVSTCNTWVAKAKFALPAAVKNDRAHTIMISIAKRFCKEATFPDNLTLDHKTVCIPFNCDLEQCEFPLYSS